MAATRTAKSYTEEIDEYERQIAVLKAKIKQVKADRKIAFAEEFKKREGFFPAEGGGNPCGTRI